MIMYHQPLIVCMRLSAARTHNLKKGRLAQGSRGKEYLHNWTSFVHRRDGVAEEDGL